MAKKEYYLYINGQPVKVSKEVYKEYYYWERKEKYFMKDLKRGKMVIDPEIGKVRIIPSREVSYEEYFNQGEPFIMPEKMLEDQLLDVLLLEKLNGALKLISEEEWKLIWELFYLEKTERQLSEDLHISRATLRYRRNKVLAKLRKFLEGDE